MKARAKLLADARTVHAGDFADLVDADIRRAAVVAKLGDAAVAGKSDAYIEARFDILLADSVAGAGDPVVNQLADAANTAGKPTVNAYDAYCASLDYRTRKEG